MAVMAAGMHLPRYRGFVGPVGEFRHGERIHVGAQADRARAVADLQRANDACLAEAAVDPEACFFEDSRHKIARPLFLETEFGMSMQVAAKGREKGQIVGNPGGHAHRQAFLEQSGKSLNSPALVAGTCPFGLIEAAMGIDEKLRDQNLLLSRMDARHD